MIYPVFSSTTKVYLLLKFTKNKILDIFLRKYWKIKMNFILKRENEMFQLLLYKFIQDYLFYYFFFFLSNNINFWNKILLLITILLIFKRKMNILVFPLVLVKRRVNIVLLCLKYNLTNLEKNNWILYLKLFTFHS